MLIAARLVLNGQVWDEKQPPTDVDESEKKGSLF